MALIRATQSSEPRIHEIGRIFKGGKKRDREKNGRTYQIMGEDLDYFRFEPSECTKTMPSPDSIYSSLYDYLRATWDALGEQQQSIGIQFLYDDALSNFDSRYNELWAKVGNAERCVRKCDGETTVLSITADGKKISKKPLPCSADPDDDECPLGCKPTARLKCLVPALRYMGVVIMTTHSIYDILEISGNLAFYDGKLSRLPFQLCRSEKSVIHDGMGMKKWLCHLAIDPRFGNALMEAAPKTLLKELLADNDNLAIEAEIVHPPQLPPSPSELSTIKKMFMDIAKEKELSNISEFAKTINNKPSSEWVLTDWELAIEKLEKLEKVEVAS
jgi:hypothetical protein